MNDLLVATAATAARHAALFERQRHAFLQAPCPSAAQRRDDLRRWCDRWDLPAGSDSFTQAFCASRKSST